jgi:hypothetical protein
MSGYVPHVTPYIMSTISLYSRFSFWFACVLSVESSLADSQMQLSISRRWFSIPCGYRYK